TLRVLFWLPRRPVRGTLVPVFYAVGVLSVPVVLITGTFIGMVLAVQAYDQFHKLGLATHLGGIVNASVVRELGPVLAATVLAEIMGIAGGAAVSVRVFHIDAHYYWRNAEGYVDLYDLFGGLVKAMVFGAAIALIGCYRGFHGEGGAEGVGKAATRSFVAS